ncbi:MAG: hypothetical protein WB822_20245 [Rhodoplanes sp.]
MDRYFDDKLGAWVKVCEPGPAIGAGDLTNWAHRRTLGLSGTHNRKEENQLKKWDALRKRKKQRRKLEAKPEKPRVKGNVRILPGFAGPPCPRCRKPMQIREHVAITEKMLRQAAYYKRWYCCMNSKCRTTLVMPEEFRVCQARPEAAPVTTGPLWSEDQAKRVDDRPPWE